MLKRVYILAIPMTALVVWWAWSYLGYDQTGGPALIREMLLFPILVAVDAALCFGLAYFWLLVKA